MYGIQLSRAPIAPAAAFFAESFQPEGGGFGAYLPGNMHGYCKYDLLVPTWTVTANTKQTYYRTVKWI
jgi:hypothetical protein